MNGEEPDREPAAPLVPRFALALAVLTGLSQGTAMLVLLATGFSSGAGLVGMAVLLAYGGAFAACIPRIRQPPALGLALVRPARLAWVASGLLLWTLLLSSEVDNLVKLVVPLPEAMTSAAGRAPASLLPLFLVSVIIYPVAQELLFRGALQPAMTKSLGVFRGILFTAVLNAIAVSMGGLYPWALAPTALNALVLGMLRETSGSLLPPLLLHACWGLVTVGAAYGAFGIPGFDDTATGAHTPFGWLAMAALFTGAGLRLCRIAGSAPALSGDPDDDSAV